MVVSMCSMSVSATCGYGHGDNFLANVCSGRTAEVRAPTCHWAGKYGGGEYHGTNCQIIQTFYYTSEICTFGSCTHDVENGKHMCFANHTQSDMYVDVCPY